MYQTNNQNKTANTDRCCRRSRKSNKYTEIQTHLPQSTCQDYTTDMPYLLLHSSLCYCIFQRHTLKDPNTVQETLSDVMKIYLRYS